MPPSSVTNGGMKSAARDDAAARGYRQMLTGDVDTGKAILRSYTALIKRAVFGS